MDKKHIIQKFKSHILVHPFILLYPIVIISFILLIPPYDPLNFWFYVLVPAFYIGVLYMPVPKSQRFIKGCERRMDEAAAFDSPKRELMMWLVAQRNANSCGGAAILDPENAKFWIAWGQYWQELWYMHRDGYYQLMNE